MAYRQTLATPINLILASVFVVVVYLQFRPKKPVTLPKGPAPPPPAASLKAKFFDGKNASGKPLVYGIIGIFLIGYTLDYQSAFTIPYTPERLLTYSVTFRPYFLLLSFSSAPQ